MLKERIKEIFEFTKSESPYRKANKGWINQDIFLDLRPSPETFAQKNEAAKVTVFWTPINTLLSNIFTMSLVNELLNKLKLNLPFTRDIEVNTSKELIIIIIKILDNKVFIGDQNSVIFAASFLWENVLFAGLKSKNIS